MKLAGIFLLLAGWGIVLCAILLFPNELPRNGFGLAGIGLEAFGMVLLFRAHQPSEREE